MLATAIVTGSDSGIGRATAVTLAERGFDVGVTWHEDEAGAQGTADEIRATGRRAIVRHLDLTGPPATITTTIDDLIGALGGIGVLVNSAGTGHDTPFVELGIDAWRRVLQVDLDGAFLCARPVVDAMIEQGQGGRIVNVTSVHEHIPKAGAAAYCAAKAGLGMLTKVMALELADHGITVNAVAPGEIATPMTGNDDVDPRRVDRAGFPVGRPGDAREVASLIAYLASDDAAYVDGSSLVVDGGLMLLAAQHPRQDAASRRP